MHSSPSKRDSAGQKWATHRECKSCVNRTQPATYWRVTFGLRIGWPGIDRTDASVCRCLFSNLEATCWPQSTAHTHTTPHHKTTIKPGFVSTSSSHQHASINNQQGKKTKDDSKNKRRICRHWDFESQFVLRIRVRNKCIKMTRCETVGRWLKFRKIHSTTSPNKYCSSKCKKKMLLCPLHAYAEYIEPTVIYRNLIALLTEKLTLAMATKNCFVHIRPWVTRMNLWILHRVNLVRSTEIWGEGKTQRFQHSLVDTGHGDKKLFRTHTTKGYTYESLNSAQSKPCP